MVLEDLFRKKTILWKFRKNSNLRILRKKLKNFNLSPLKINFMVKIINGK